MRSFYSSKNLRQLSDAALEKAYERSLSRAWWRDELLSAAAPVITFAVFAGGGALGAGLALLFGAPAAAVVAAAIVTAAVGGTGGVAVADFATQVYEMNRNDEDLKLKDEVRRRQRAQMEPLATPALAMPAAKEGFAQTSAPRRENAVAGARRAKPNKLVL